jgi:hypothetical protein
MSCLKLRGIKNGYSPEGGRRPADHMRRLHIRPLCAVSVRCTRVSVGTSPRKDPRQRTGLPLPKDGLADDEPHKDISLLGGSVVGGKCGAECTAY